MESFVAVIICAASQYPDKLADKVQYLLENNGYTRQNSTHKVTLDAVIPHSEKPKEEPAPEIDPDAVKKSSVKIFAHYITIEVRSLGAALGDVAV